MKKVLLSAIAVMTAVSVANAEPRFGLVGFTGTQTNNAGNAAHGIFVTDDMWNASLAFASRTYDDNAASAIQFKANYKQPIDSMTALTVGIGYITESGDLEVDGNVVDIEDTNRLDINVGVERMLSSNLVFSAEGSVYSTGKVGDVDVSQIAGNAQIGIAYLF